ncbi:MAG: RNA polymerase sigma-70 factor [Verrucomicrobia bacterium]|nr:MAG: RNA polymerase sigma-70 factor [Verrucomicrobiota bacterium]
MQAASQLPTKHEVFIGLRPYLYVVASHILANTADAEDMVQECYLRWEKTDESQVRVPKAFLTTTVTRLCLKHLQSARVQREETFGSAVPEAIESELDGDAEAHSRLAESLSEAFLVMLKALSPLERVVFLMWEVFDCEYEEIAAVVDKSEENCRQILRRAREAVATRRPRYEVLPLDAEQVLNRFLQAATQGDSAGLMEVLSNDATLVCDGSDLSQGPISVQGEGPVADLVRDRASRWLGDGALIKTVRFKTCPGLLAYRNGLPVSAIFVSLRHAEIRSLRVITCPVRLRSLLVLC